MANEVSVSSFRDGMKSLTKALKLEEHLSEPNISTLVDTRISGIKMLEDHLEVQNIVLRIDLT